MRREEAVLHLHELGFDAVGLARPRLPDATTGAFRRRVASGAFDVMPWLPRSAERRLDPDGFMPGCRSVFVAAVAYGPRPGEAAAELTVARYARGWDYHTWVRERLERFGAWLEERAPDVRWRAAVDAEPVLEKALAVEAGIGWLGRNGLVAHPEHGSWIVLGEVFTDLDLPRDRPLPSPCGACEACVRACPAGAITPDGVDPGRCAAFLTVERVSPLSAEERTVLGPRVFGCDTCLAACPHNAAARPGSASALVTAETPSADEFASMSEDEFARRFAGTAVARAVRRGLRAPG